MGFISSARAVVGKSRESSQDNAVREKDKFYPVRIGQIFCKRYKVKDRLGSGRYASVWLVRDARSVKLNHE